MSSTWPPKRINSSLSTGDGGRKRPKRSQSVLPAEGGEDTLEKGSGSLLSGEEADQRDNAGGGIALKKGPWKKEEDEILVDHIKKYGEGKWDGVKKKSGLAREGKSCRLRWVNHLKPGLKKSVFTAEEERLILEFHFLKGCKWSQMAAMLPGRTDNEIKNFWYARDRKHERLGLPIYPDEITSKYSLKGSQESADTLPNESRQVDETLANESRQPDETEKFKLDITDLDLKHFKFHPDMLPPCFDTKDYKQISDLVGRSSDPSHNTLPMRRAAVVRSRYLISSNTAAVPVPQVFDQYAKYHNPITAFHAASNISSSQPIYGSMSFEPPSFQNLQTQQYTWSGISMSQLPSFESTDTAVQPCLPVPVPPSQDCSHLVDPSVYYNSDQNLKGSSIDSLQANTNSMAPNKADISTQRNGRDYNQHVALTSSQPISFDLPSFQNSQTQQSTWRAMYVSQLPSLEPVATPVQAPPIQPCLPVPVPPSPDCRHLVDSSVYCNSDQNLKGSSIDSLQANTDSMAPNEADISTKRNGRDYNQHVALTTSQIDFLRRVCERRNFLRWVRSEIGTTQG